jgi:hypothetical protein
MCKFLPSYLFFCCKLRSKESIPNNIIILVIDKDYTNFNHPIRNGMFIKTPHATIKNSVQQPDEEVGRTAHDHKRKKATSTSSADERWRYLHGV